MKFCDYILHFLGQFWHFRKISSIHFRFFAKTKIIKKWPTILCRPPEDCETDLPIPEGSSKLQNSASTNVKEFDFAIYTCEETFTLEGVDFENVENNKFKVECLKDGVYPHPQNISWPTCKPTVCPADTIPSPTGLTTSASGNTLIGNSIDFTCATSGEVMEILVVIK